MALSCTAGASTASPPENGCPDILILHSYHKGFSWTDSIEQAIRTTLADKLPHARVATEYMDTKNHFSPAFMERLLAFYRYKFSGKRPDLVICCDDNAFNFMLEKGRQIFGRVPVVFCGVNYFKDEMIRDCPEFTGVVEAFDARSTLDLALALHPQTRTLAVVVDRTPTGRSTVRRLNELLPAYTGIYSFIMLDDLTMDGLLARVRSLPEHSLILLLNFNRDRNGQIFSHEETAERLHQASSVPIYGAWDFHLNHGIAGGMITTGRGQGETAARLALRILRGVPPREIPVVRQSPNQWMFDYKQLIRFGLDKSRLPAGSIIINRPVSFYEVNKKIIWGLAGAILFLVAIIFILTVNIIGRKKAQAELRDTAEKLASLLEALPIVPFAISSSSAHRFLYVSRAITGIAGYQPDDFTNDPEFWQRRIHPDDLVMVKKKIKAPDLYKERLTYRFLTSQGKYKWFSDTRRPVSYASGKSRRVAGFWQDVTVEETLRQKADQRLQQVIQADKLASLGELVAGVAHEIRNPNAFISTNLPLLKETWDLLRPVIESASADDPSPADIQEWCMDMDSMLDDITAGSERIDRVVRELNEFTRSAETSEMYLLQINEVIQKAQVLLGAQIRKTFDRFTLILDPDLPLITAHPTKLEQVVANLVVNATHAVRPCCKAELRIYTRQLKDPPAVLIQVEDNGRGIAPELRERIFEPFFTTRREKGGTGLGLSVCYRLVQEHQGAIFLVSRPGQGSRFTVALPCRAGQPIKIQPTLLWVDTDIRRLENVTALAGKIKGVQLIGLSDPDRLLDRLGELPQVLTVCLAGFALDSGLKGRLKEIETHRPLVTRSVYSGEDHLDGDPRMLAPLADTLVSGPLTAELLRHITYVNLRKIL